MDRSVSQSEQKRWRFAAGLFPGLGRLLAILLLPGLAVIAAYPPDQFFLGKLAMGAFAAVGVAGVIALPISGYALKKLK